MNPERRSQQHVDPSHRPRGVLGARLVPMGQLPARVGELDRDTPVYVVCASGNRSAAMTQYLRSAGVDAYSVAGGTSAWQVSGRPVVTGTRER